MTTKPNELTEEMIEAGFQVLWRTEFTELADKPAHYKEAVRRIYLAMQSASPATSEDVVGDFLNDLDGWESAYPLTVFPEPDLKKAASILKAGGMTLDAISASNMRHVVSCIAPKARAAIAALASPASEDVVERAVEDALEMARHRAIVLFNGYALGVSMKHKRSEGQFRHDVNTFNAELTDALKIPRSFASPTPRDTLAVVEAAQRFCAELCEDADGVPQLELKALHEALDAYEGTAVLSEIYDDSSWTSSVMAALKEIAEDGYQSDRTRRAVTEAMKLLAALKEAQQAEDRESDRRALLHIVFDGPPGPEAGRFVECETPDGRSVNAGEWHERSDGLWELRLKRIAEGMKG